MKLTNRSGHLPLRADQILKAQKPPRLPGTGAALSGDELEAHLAEVHARTMQRAADAMEEAMRPKKATFENCDDYDPFSW